MNALAQSISFVDKSERKSCTDNDKTLTQAHAIDMVVLCDHDLRLNSINQKYRIK